MTTKFKIQIFAAGKIKHQGLQMHWTPLQNTIPWRKISLPPRTTFAVGTRPSTLRLVRVRSDPQHAHQLG